MAKQPPPRSTRFKPGQSGNPKGRPRKIPELDQLLADVLGEESPDGTTTAKQILKALAKKALKGDVRAIEVLLDRCYGRAKQRVDLSGSVTTQPGFDFTQLADDDLQKVSEIVAKYPK